MVARRGSGRRYSLVLMPATLGAMVVAALSLGGSAAASSTITVYCNHNGGTPNLQSTIDSNLAPTIRITGTCVGNFHVDGSVTTVPLTLQGGAPGATLDGSSSGAVLKVFGGATVTLKKLTVTNGEGGSLSGGGIDVQDCPDTVVNLSSVTVTGNDAQEGGGIFVGTCATVNLTSSHVNGNTAFAGAGIYAEDGAMVNLYYSTVNSNSTGTDSGIGAGIYADAATVLVKSSVVSDNGDPYEGGGIYAFDSEVTLINSTVSDNQSDGIGGIYGGGGIWMQGSDVYLTGSHVTGNSSGDYGGGIAYYGGAGVCAAADAPCAYPDVGLTITNSTIDQNTADARGGGIYAWAQEGDTSVTINGGSTVMSNTVTDGNGGGVYNYAKNCNSAMLWTDQTAFVENSAADGRGGAIYNAVGTTSCGTASVTLSRTQVTRNNQAADGGGIFNLGTDGETASVTLEHGTDVTFNRASEMGGGVYDCANATLSIQSSSVVIHNDPDNIFSGPCG